MRLDKINVCALAMIVSSAIGCNVSAMNIQSEQWKIASRGIPTFQIKG